MATQAPDLPPDMVTRQYRRTVYDFTLWRKHRNVDRYLRNLQTLPGSRIIRTLLQPMGVVLLWAAMYGFYEQCIDAGILPGYMPNLKLASAEPQGLTSFALSLLLVFRTNSSYGRFDEARKIWGGILNRARNIANQAVTFVPPEDAAGREAVGKWTVGFCRALQAHLQEDADLRLELSKATPRWSQKEIDMLVNAQHRPIKAISMLSELTRQLPISQFQALQMQENCTFFYDALGGCERLLRTPIPVSYTRHTSRFLLIWLALLPVGLWDRYHWSMLPVIALIGFLLLGIDEIGVQIEEPFGILPLDAICTRAQTDVVSLLKDDKEVSQYIADYREGRIKAPPGPPPAPPAPPAPAAASGGAAAGLERSSSPQQEVMKTMATMLSNIKAGAGPVAPGSPSGSRANSPQRPRVTTPLRANSPVAFPPASAGTGTGARPAASASAAPRAATRAAAAKPAAPAPAAGMGFSLPSMPTMPKFGGLADAVQSAGEKLSKMADSVTAAPPGGEANRPPAVPQGQRKESVRRDAPSGNGNGNGASSSRNGGGGGAAEGGIRGANWREELDAARGLAASVTAERGSRATSDTASYTNGNGSNGNNGMSDADAEAMRRFGNLAGRSRSGSASPAGSDGDSGARSQKPRTRPDWREQL